MFFLPPSIDLVLHQHFCCFSVLLICTSIKQVVDTFQALVIFFLTLIDSTVVMEMPYNDDPLALQSYDHPGFQLINLKLNGHNFQQWSKYVRIELRTKGKLGFLDGSCPRPAVNSPQFDQWIRCDSMVLSWLLNSMIPELAEAFLYVDSTKEL